MVHYNHESDNALGTIFSPKCQHQSKRQLMVVLEKCKHCNHRKAIVNASVRGTYDSKCSRCKR